ncbi:lipopolysaccharide core biosynthesis glycosyltra nsferase (GT9) [Formosa agariphila KMM 3901]|uniref:Lipopolysaccharide core biosynthesis glycosyltra nsferase (GT9) n=2 Tax=Formosa TaxID=225842 RepID=T2KR47_FORAG|nr:lipopolysaccharide core biosynthesis glycosyltra nsferase (GT9) [Formosa agariphila KMM 3901]
MGDVAMSVPVLRALTSQYPNLKVTVLTRPFFEPFFRDLDAVSIVPADLNGVHKGVFGLYKLSKSLKKQNIDAVADIHNVLRSKILKAFFIGTPFIQIDKGRSEKKALTSGAVFKQLPTTISRYAEVFNNLGFPIDLSQPTFPEPSILSDKLQAILGGHGTKWIGIAPFAAHDSKMYPIEQMETVIETLSKNYKVFLFGGGAKEVEILNGFQAKYNAVINLAGQLNFNEELDIISNLDVMLSMDSGNGHMAAMLGKKVITIWGVTHPFAGFAPFNQPDDYALTADRVKFPLIPTSIYGNKFPEGYEKASGTIAPETIVNKIISVI